MKKMGLKRRLHIQFLLRFGIISGPNIVPLCSKNLGQSLGQTFCFILAQIKYQIAEQIGCVDAALGRILIKMSWASFPENYLFIYCSFCGYIQYKNPFH